MFEPQVPFLFVIDTDQYSGNFERPMCAYLTGRVGECGVGDEYKDLFEQECNVAFFNVTEGPDEHGCFRPATIYPSPGLLNDGMGNHYTENDDPQTVTDNYRKTLVEYYTQHKNSAKVEESKSAVPGKHPAYQSVAILFSSRPTNEQIEIMKERAAKFTTLHIRKFDDFTKIKITGFRLVEKEVKVKSEAV